MQVTATPAMVGFQKITAVKSIHDIDFLGKISI